MVAGRGGAGAPLRWQRRGGCREGFCGGKGGPRGVVAVVAAWGMAWERRAVVALGGLGVPSGGNGEDAVGGSAVGGSGGGHMQWWRWGRCSGRAALVAMGRSTKEPPLWWYWGAWSVRGLL